MGVTTTATNFNLRDTNRTATIRATGGVLRPGVSLVLSLGLSTVAGLFSRSILSSRTVYLGARLGLSPRLLLRRLSIYPLMVCAIREFVTPQ